MKDISMLLKDHTVYDMVKGIYKREAEDVISGTRIKERSRAVVAVE